MESIVVKENEEKILPVLWTGVETELSYEIRLAGKGASIKFLGLLLGSAMQSLFMDIKVVHEAQNTTSSVIIKSALSDGARVDIEGLVKIEHGAIGTNAYLAAHLLLLSESAKGRAVPSLEILENDIKAGHGTTVGRINDMEIFYLMSRGLSKSAAKALIVEGFLQEMISQFPKELARVAQRALKI